MSRITALLGVAALALALSAAAPAYADATVVCTGSVTIEYTPPLGPLPQQTSQKVTELLGSAGGGTCTGPYAGASATTTFDQAVGCLAQGLGDTLVTNVVTYHWTSGAVSTITYPVTTVAHVADQIIVTSTGNVTSGYAQGALSERIAAYPDLDVLSCLSSGVAEQDGVLTVTLT